MKPREMLLGLTVALFLAIVLSPFASSWPDGLEKVAGDKGFLSKCEGKPALAAPVPDYAWPGVKSEHSATRVAGAVGTLVVFALAWGIGTVLAKKRD